MLQDCPVNPRAGIPRQDAPARGGAGEAQGDGELSDAPTAARAARTHTAGSPARAGLGSASREPRAGGRRLREASSPDAAGTGDGHQGPRPSARVPRRAPFTPPSGSPGTSGALAFLDARDGRLVVLPGDGPVDAWARYTASPESGADRVSVPAVLTFVHRADVPKAPETVTRRALQEQQALRSPRPLSRPRSARRTGAPRSDWTSSSASSPSRSRRRSRRRTRRWPPRARTCRPH